MPPVPASTTAPVTSSTNNTKPNPYYIKTKHIIDAAYPRTTQSSTIIPSDKLKLVYNKYVPSAPLDPNKITFNFIFGHLSATSKAVWNYHIDLLYEYANGGNKSNDSQLNWQVGTVVAVDFTMQGESALLNKYKLGLTFAWKDSGEDLIQVIVNENLNLPAGPPNKATATTENATFDAHIHLGRYLAPQPATTTPGHLIAIGCSFGGHATLFACIWKPNLFDSLIVAEPLCYFSPAFVKRASKIVDKAMLLNWSDFPSREAAIDFINTKSAFKKFHPAIKQHIYDEELYFDSEEKDPTRKWKRLSPYKQSKLIMTGNPALINALCANLPILSRPVTHVVGKVPNFHFPEDTAKIIQAMDSSGTRKKKNKLVVLNGGHTCAFDLADEFFEVMVQHIERRVDDAKLLEKRDERWHISELDEQQREEVQERWWREYNLKGMYKYWDPKL